MRIISICNAGLQHKPGVVNPIIGRLEMSSRHAFSRHIA